MLGELVAGIAEINAIVKGAKEIIADTDSVLKGVAEVMKVLNEGSEGQFSVMLKEATVRLTQIFERLIGAFNLIMEGIIKAMEYLEGVDRENANNLKSVVI